MASINHFQMQRDMVMAVAVAFIFIFSSSNIMVSVSSANAPPFKKIYAFGDSFTDTGNTRSISGPVGFGHVSTLPYGSTFFHRPTNRYSDGRLVIDFVAQSLSLPFLPPYLQAKGNPNAAAHGVNFAVAGSTAIDHDFFVKNNLSLDITPESLRTQLGWFESYLESQGCGECREEVEDALFWVGEIGVNDYAYTVGSDISSHTIRQLALHTYTQFLQELLKKGAKYVLVQNLPTTGCLPLAMTLASVDDRDDIGCVKTENSKSYVHNFFLQARIQDLRRQFPESIIVYADYYNAYRAVMKNPGSFGFKESFKACCGTGEPYNFAVFATCGTPNATACANPAQYINWDGVHLTEAMYKVLAGMFLEGKFTQPAFSSLLRKRPHEG